MNLSRTLIALALGGAAFGANGCIVYEQGPPVVHREVIVADRPGPPPVVVPARAQRWQKMHYRYYPEEQVYYNIDLGRWYWMEDNRWCDAQRLPDPVRLSLHAGVMIDLDGDRPREFHDRVLRMYPPHREEYSSRR